MTIFPELGRFFGSGHFFIAGNLSSYFKFS